MVDGVVLVVDATHGPGGLLLSFLSFFHKGQRELLFRPPPSLLPISLSLPHTINISPNQIRAWKGPQEEADPSRGAEQDGPPQPTGRRRGGEDLRPLLHPGSGREVSAK